MLAAEFTPPRGYRAKLVVGWLLSRLAAAALMVVMTPIVLAYLVGHVFAPERPWDTRETEPKTKENK
jgi:hypothetical protein